MATIDLKELEEFNEMVDGIIDDIETGKVKANPLAPNKVEVAEADASEVVVKETATELGEDAIIEEISASTNTVTINGKTFNYAEDGDDIIGQPSKSLVVISNSNGEVIFGNAATAAREVGFNPTTVRDRCTKEYVDADDNTWSYRKMD